MGRVPPKKRSHRSDHTQIFTDSLPTYGCPNNSKVLERSETDKIYLLTPESLRIIANKFARKSVNICVCEKFVVSLREISRKGKDNEYILQLVETLHQCAG